MDIKQSRIFLWIRILTSLLTTLRRSMKLYVMLVSMKPKALFSRAEESITNYTSRRILRLWNILFTTSQSTRECLRLKELLSLLERNTILYLEISKSVIHISENWIPISGKIEDHLTQLQFYIPRIKMMGSPFNLELFTPQKERPTDQLLKSIKRTKISMRSLWTRSYKFQLVIVLLISEKMMKPTRLSSWISTISVRTSTSLRLIESSKLNTRKNSRMDNFLELHRNPISSLTLSRSSTWSTIRSSLFLRSITPLLNKLASVQS